MVASDTKSIIERLEFLVSGNGNVELLRSLFAHTPEAQNEPLFPVRYRLLNNVENTVHNTADFMKRCADGWYIENQERADNNKTIQIKDRELYQSMVAFMSATEMPIHGLVGLYNPLRVICQQWIDYIHAWYPEFPELMDTNKKEVNQDPRPTSTPATVTVPRDKLAMFFGPKFKEPRPRTGMEPLPPGFDMFYNALVTGAGNFTPTDIGRIAYQVHQSKHVLPRFRNMPFARFARLFYDGCGVPAPKDLGPRKYKSTTRATQFDCWLE